jgi:hypothetical protein
MEESKIEFDRLVEEGAKLTKKEDIKANTRA